MLQSNERETEILLGNKQLLGIFFVGAVLLGVAFTGGYMVGRGPSTKRTSTTTDAVTTSGTNPTVAQVGETHSVKPNDEVASTIPDTETSRAAKSSEDLLGSRRKKAAKTQALNGESVLTNTSSKTDGFAPQSGQEFLQVAAVPRDHALAVASVLRRKGFRAHAVAKPGEVNTYRVIVGPIRNAGELSSTRDSLRKTGFNQVLVQHYQ